jgi:hypothetical protein
MDSEDPKMNKQSTTVSHRALLASKNGNFNDYIKTLGFKEVKIKERLCLHTMLDCQLSTI